MKLHLGCGSIYLKEYINVDLKGPKMFLAEERPDLVEKLLTTEAKYYARHEDKTIDTLRSGPLNPKGVCDEYGSFTRLPFPPNKVGEILARQVLEHLSPIETYAGLRECNRVLCLSGLLRLDVPDFVETVKALVDTGDKFYLRHLLGVGKGSGASHLMHYSRESLISLCNSFGFRFVLEEPNIHFYPAFCLRFVKVRTL